MALSAVLVIIHWPRWCQSLNQQNLQTEELFTFAQVRSSCLFLFRARYICQFKQAGCCSLNTLIVGNCTICKASSPVIASSLHSETLQSLGPQLSRSHTYLDSASNLRTFVWEKWICRDLPFCCNLVTFWFALLHTCICIYFCHWGVLCLHTNVWLCFCVSCLG